ncbi:hypothetical protein RCO28_26615 [Streptomyces sp. LHD-70]|uniref:hypothetical protein n=1 Tax=Streptomyces sp. LHD-70 TaxID=3072140 RepID=UPI00280CFDB6|nr:hypothetical protein [Streptomyces sp. LHD-70]MDQ8706023.1 hypothetical protein [Streptomyces sp. LHD-70]
MLLARPRTRSARDTARWEFPANPAAVAYARHLTVCQLVDQGFRLGLAIELVVSELVTNATRYEGGPIGLRRYGRQGKTIWIEQPLTHL